MRSIDELAELGLAGFGSNVQIDPTARFFGAGRITIGSNVRIDAFAVISAGAGGIDIGDYVHIAAHVFMAGAARIVVEDFVGLSGRVSVYSSNDDYSGGHLSNPTAPDDLRDVTSAPVTFHRHALIGAGSVILPGVTIGEGGAAGALSLVRRDVEPWTTVVGTPARVVGERRRDLLQLETELRARE